MRDDEGAELRHDLDEPLVAQAHERLADGRAADPEPGGELVLRQTAAGSELGTDDGVAQDRIHLGTRWHPTAPLCERN